MIKKKTQHFLIFEVLVALFIITMSILPFSSYPYRAFKKELSLLEKITMEPYFTETFEEAIAQKDNYVPTSLKVPFGKKDKLNIKREVIITILKNHEEANGTLYEVKATLSSKNASITRSKNYFAKENK